MSFTDTSDDLLTSTRMAPRWRRLASDGKVVSDDIDALLADVATEVRAGRHRPAARLLLHTGNRWMTEERTDFCVQLLLRADPRELETTAALGVLAALDPIRDRTVDARRDFVQRLRTYLFQTRSETEANELMKGVR